MGCKRDIICDITAMYAWHYVMRISCDFASHNQTDFKSPESCNGQIRKSVWLWCGNLGIVTGIVRCFAQHCIWVQFFTTFYMMSHKKTSHKPTLLFLIQKHWFSPILLGCYDILMDVIVCDTLWYLIRPIGRLLKRVFCEMWEIILCSQCRTHVKDYVSKVN